MRDKRERPVTFDKISQAEDIDNVLLEKNYPAVLEG